MSNDERHARSLGRWLDQPAGTTPPDDVDSDAVEAVYALRPDLAPPPRVSADDILALVTKGPLAGSSHANTPVGAERSGEVVPFPARRSAPSTSEAEAPSADSPPARRNRFVVYAGGTGGIGLALVAAATLLLVAVPALQGQSGPSAGEPVTQSPGASVISRAEEAPALSPPAALEPTPSADDASPARAASRPAPVPSARVPAQPSAAAGPSPSAPPAKEMASGKRLAEEQAIPELSERAQQQVAAEAAVRREVEGRYDQDEGEPASQPAAAAPLLARAPAVDASSVRSRGVPSDRDGSSWRSGVDGDTLATLDQAIAKASELRAQGNRRGAGDALAAAVQSPPRAGQHLAALAAADYLGGGDPRAAAGVAQRGLSLGSGNTPERSWLLVIYGDALRAQDQQAAAIDAYEQASDLNVQR